RYQRAAGTRHAAGSAARPRGHRRAPLHPRPGWLRRREPVRHRPARARDPAVRGSAQPLRGQPEPRRGHARHPPRHPAPQAARLRHPLSGRGAAAPYNRGVPAAHPHAMTTDRLPLRRALLSVSDKTGLVDLARALAAHGVELLSTGGTARTLREAGLAVRDVSEVTGFPEMMDGRVKTLHPVVHGGLLGRAGIDEVVMAEHGIGAIDLLVLNLYPFESVTAKADCTLAEAVENIDIGGPAMLR